MTRSPGNLVCRILGHSWRYDIIHATAVRLCVRCGKTGWHR
jgi:hypothetical protein